MSGPDPTPQPLDHLALRGEREAVALTTGKQVLTYAELEAEVGRAAARLTALGLGAGDRVASWMGKTAVACILPLACARAGLVHVPINPVLKRAQAAHILADSGARLLIGNEARLQSLDPADRAEARLLPMEDWSAAGRNEVQAPSSHEPDTLAALMYTSGSTGTPKGVMLSHANLWLGAISVADFLGLTASDQTLAVLPLAFDYGQSQLLSTWAAGGHVVAFEYLLPRDVVRAVGRHGVTVLAGVPPLWLQLSEQEWGASGASLRTLTNSGGHLAEPVVRKLRALFPDARLHLMYGLTEAFRSTSLDPTLVDDHPDSVGSAIPFAEVMVVRPDGNEAGPGEEGELVHAGPLVGQGYWKDPVKTAERYKPAPRQSVYGGTAVWSGDTVIRGEDGLVRFRGRSDAMIKVSGNRISPNEIEAAALSSGAASEALAIGIPDDRLGQAILLIATPKSDDPDGRLRAYFSRELPAFMMPSRIVWRTELPLSPNGKLDRSVLAREYI